MEVELQQLLVVGAAEADHGSAGFPVQNQQHGIHRSASAVAGPGHGSHSLVKQGRGRQHLPTQGQASGAVDAGENGVVTSGAAATPAEGSQIQRVGEAWIGTASEPMIEDPRSGTHHPELVADQLQVAGGVDAGAAEALCCLEGAGAGVESPEH